MIIDRLDYAKSVAREAGLLIMDAYGHTTSYDFKRGDVDLVTATDLASEKLLTSGITERFAEDRIVAEEQGDYDLAGDSGYTWYIDPLDGTTNFAHGFPIFSVSIGILHNGELAAGVILQPVTGDCFWARRGGGAWCNDKPIRVSETGELGRSLLATGFPYNRRQIADELLGRVDSAFQHSQGVRRAGAASVDLCFVACGQLDGYWEQNLAPWDWAAGALLVQEAGGTISDYSGKPYPLFGDKLVASNGRIHAELIARITDNHKQDSAASC